MSRVRREEAAALLVGAGGKQGEVDGKQRQDDAQLRVVDGI